MEELRTFLQWLRRDLHDARNCYSEHAVLVDRLEELLVDAEGAFNLIEIIIQIESPAMLRRADVIATQLEQQLWVASNIYVGGLRRQTEADRETRRILPGMSLPPS